MRPLRIFSFVTMILAVVGAGVSIFFRDEFLVAFFLGYASGSWLAWMSGGMEEMIRKITEKETR